MLSDGLACAARLLALARFSDPGVAPPVSLPVSQWSPRLGALIQTKSLSRTRGHDGKLGLLGLRRMCCVAASDMQSQIPNSLARRLGNGQSKPGINLHAFAAALHQAPCQKYRTDARHLDFGLKTCQPPGASCSLRVFLIVSTTRFRCLGLALPL